MTEGACATPGGGPLDPDSASDTNHSLLNNGSKRTPTPETIERARGVPPPQETTPDADNIERGGLFRLG